MNMKRNKMRSQHRNQRGGGGGGMNMRRPGGDRRGSSSHFNIVPDRRNLRKAQEAKEKYLNMAKDAVAYGDRVTAEYYYQHADHYHRVMRAIEEEIAEFEQSRQQRQPSGEEGAPVEDSGQEMGGDAALDPGAAAPEGENPESARPE